MPPLYPYRQSRPRRRVDPSLLGLFARGGAVAILRAPRDLLRGDARAARSAALAVCDALARLKNEQPRAVFLDEWASFPMSSLRAVKEQMDRLAGAHPAYIIEIETTNLYLAGWRLVCPSCAGAGTFVVAIQGPLHPREQRKGVVE